MSSEFFDKVFERIGRIDSESLKGQLKRLSGELAMMETVFRSVHEGIVIISGKGRLVYANGAAEHILSIDASKLKGKAVSGLFGDFELTQAGVSDKGRAERGEEWSRLLTREMEITYPERRIVSFYAVPMDRAAEGAPDNTLLILRDVTREREQEENALRDERLDAVKTLAASVAHEIGNPLNALDIHLQLLARSLHGLDAEGRDSLEEMVGVARSEVRRLDGIITQFLQALRHSSPVLEPGDVIGLIGETLATLKAEIENRRIEVTVSGGGRVPPVMVDAGQIRQVFYNLVKNAMEAMPDGGHLDISVSADDSWLRVDFSDNGMGIPKESLGRIFDAYHTTKKKGTGLGLMIVQRIVKEHGGQIEVSSKEGEGTRFRIMLPLAERRVRKLRSGS